MHLGRPRRADGHAPCRHRGGARRHEKGGGRRGEPRLRGQRRRHTHRNGGLLRAQPGAARRAEALGGPAAGEHHRGQPRLRAREGLHHPPHKRGDRHQDLRSGPMQEEKSKIEGFTSAVITAAEQHAARINEETEQLEREAIDNYAADLKAAAAKRRAAALADAKVRENKRVVSEGLAAKRSLLQFREDCAADVFAEVRRRVLALHDSAGYAGTLQDQLLRALSAVPGAHSAVVELRHEDMARAADLAAAAPGVELKFVEGAFTLGGLVLDCAEAGRKIDLTFDAALEDLEGRFSEITGFSLEDADGK